MSRTKLILDWLRENPAGAAFAALHQAVDPECKKTVFSSQLNQLKDVDKVVTTGSRGSSVFKLGPKADFDGRRRSPAAQLPKPAPRPPAAPRVAKPPKPKPNRPVYTPAAVRDPERPSKFEIRAAAVKSAPAKKVAMTVEEFLADGGQIEYLPRGAVSKPLQFGGHRGLNEANWRDRVNTD